MKVPVIKFQLEIQLRFHYSVSSINDLSQTKGEASHRNTIFIQFTKDFISFVGLFSYEVHIF